ncbi:FAD-binding oxidoreductase [Celeribacter arenosi]|uniref:FAD-binding oxidoreductase n=1 Tax=Celeribacter arenosi TaxID=792649 RepID=A0ABP7KB34_9RHOB
MNLLYSNDRRGTYPPSWYAATASMLDPLPELKGEQHADVCVVGAGYTGLSAALHLAQKGLDVVVVDAQRVGFGASGRNGGHVGTGFNLEPWTLEKLVGEQNARRLWDFSEEGKALTRSLIEAHAPDAHLRDGIAHAQWKASGVADYHKLVDWLAETYGYEKGEKLDRDAMQALVKSPRYQGGIVDWGSAHIHPLNYVLGLARACLAAGVRLHELSPVHKVDGGSNPVVRCDRGFVHCSHVVLATNGYGGRLNAKVAARVMPINNFMVATEPLGERAADVLSKEVAVDDSKFVVNYFHLSPDKRLIFGGGESYGYKFPADIAAKVRPRMENLFPQLQGVKIDYAWGGTLAITMTRMPYLTRPAPNVWSSSGYSGYGVSLSGFCGKLMAEAIAGETERFDLFSNTPAMRFPGGARTRQGLLAIAMTWYSLRDKLGI